ncbi:MAG: insulinase family protein [Candidatus Manganitrophus sp. SA1]|nr:insulinase family protein [Candidatus Manganitrophus morganii]
MVRKVVLDNGMRIVAEKMASVKSVSIGLWVNVGSRDEEAHEHGISHFLEHMFFKGTEKRSAKEIAREIDAIGGELNAFTSRETTTFYAKVLDDHLSKAVEILSDNFHHSTFEPREIEKEKQVVIEEIKMVEDDPEDLVHDLYTKDIWKGNTLGRPILGTVETISGMTRKKILRFLKRAYDPKQIVVSVAGHFDLPPLMKALEKAFGKYSAKEIDLHPRLAPQMSPHFQVKKRNLEQVHICIGTQGLPHRHPDRYALYVLNTILGGSVSSRLFQEVRERRGLAYSIYSYPSSYQDGGLFTVYAGTGAKNAPKVIVLILKEFKRLKEKGVDPVELEKAKNHIKGSLMLSMESTSSRMSKLAKDELYFGRHFSLEEVVREINRVSLDQVQQLAKVLFDSKHLSLTALGKIDPTLLPQDLSL